MLVFKISLFLIIFNLINCLNTKYLKKRFTALEARGPNNLEYSINILTKLNSDYVFPLVIGQNEKVAHWLLTKQTKNSFSSNNQDAATEAIYDARSLPRNITLAKEYACLPSEQNCNQLSINNFDVNDIGVYLFRFDMDFLTLKTFTFNMSAYMNSISFACSNGGTNDSMCVFNAATQTLSVIADEPVMLACDIQVLQNGNYPISAQFNFISELYGEECKGNTKVDTESISELNANNHLLQKKLSKNCTRTFTKQDSFKGFQCKLNPIVSSTQSINYQQTKTYESLDMKLDVQYGPDPTLPLNPIPPTSSGDFNKTQMVGDDIIKQTFVCPFIGNPAPLYYWRVVSSTVNQTMVSQKSSTLTPSSEFSLSDSQEFPINSDLQVGEYSLECKAKVAGMINKFSPVIKFNLKTIPPPPAPVRNPNENVNVGAIVGGIIGGLAMLAVVVIVVIAVLRIKRTNNPKNEIEKAKELDIDITDHHQNDLNTRKANLVQQQQQQQVKQQLGGNKVIAGLNMPPNSTAQAYASIAHAAAAAAQSNLQRNGNNNGFSGQNSNQNIGSNDLNFQNSNSTTNTSVGSNNNLINSNLLNTHNNNTLKSQSYNNPGFFESASYSTQGQNPLESPPPYDAALHQPIKKDSPPPTQQQQHINQRLTQQQQLINQQQKEYMGSSTRLISGSNTPIQGQRPSSQSYTANTPQNMSLINSTPNNNIGSSLQGLQYNPIQSGNTNLQYTSVQNMENRLARSRNPLNGPIISDMENQQQYTTMAAQLSSNPIDV